jgi:hypothetical protein
MERRRSIPSTISVGKAEQPKTSCPPRELNLARLVHARRFSPVTIGFWLGGAGMGIGGCLLGALMPYRQPVAVALSVLWWGIYFGCFGASVGALVGVFADPAPTWAIPDRGCCWQGANGEGTDGSYPWKRPGGVLGIAYRTAKRHRAYCARLYAALYDGPVLSPIDLPWWAFINPSPAFSLLGQKGESEEWPRLGARSARRG